MKAGGGKAGSNMETFFHPQRYFSSSETFDVIYRVFQNSDVVK